MMLKDHQILRLAYTNRHQIAPRMWRSNQPDPRQLRCIKDLGIQTVINLRGSRDCGSYILESEACELLGLTLVNFPINSRAAPAKDKLHKMAELFYKLDYPALMHCKSGADRVGLMSVLYLFMHEGFSFTEARRQLHWRYGHFRLAKTGILDYFLDSYATYANHTAIPFLRWVDDVYDPDSLTRNFHAQWWWSLLEDKILRRE